MQLYIYLPMQTPKTKIFHIEVRDIIEINILHHTQPFSNNEQFF